MSETKKVIAQSQQLDELPKHITKIEHRNFRNDDFWKDIPAWSSVTRGEFADYRWQLKNSIIFKPNASVYFKKEFGRDFPLCNEVKAYSHGASFHALTLNSRGIKGLLSFDIPIAARHDR